MFMDLALQREQVMGGRGKGLDKEGRREGQGARGGLDGFQSRIRWFGGYCQLFLLFQSATLPKSVFVTQFMRLIRYPPPFNHSLPPSFLPSPPASPNLLFYTPIGNAQIFELSYAISCPFPYKTIIITYLMDQILQILKDHEVSTLASLQEKDVVLIEKRPGLAEPKERSRKIVEGTISHNVPKEKFNAIMLKADELGLLVDIEQTLPLGGPFGDYGEIDNVYDEGKTHLKHEAGEVLLVDVWATWCDPCQRPMQHNQEMLVKNEAGWAGKVRIVGVSVDDEKEKIKQRVDSKGWNKIQHLTLLGWKHDHKLIGDFSINGIPFVCLVNKFGKINFVGHPSSINLEGRINELIAQDKEVDEAPAAPEQAITEVKPQSQPILLTKDYLLANFPNAELLCIKSNKVTSLEKGVLSQKASIEAHVFEGDHNTAEALKDKFYAAGAELKINYVKTVDVPHPENPTCWECHAALVFPYYWLRWEEGTHFGCVACVEKPSEQEGHHFKYEKNSVLLTGPWNKIPVKGLGDNIQPEDVTKQDGGHQFGCNGCGGGSGLGQARYICLGCRADPNFNGDYVDLCQDCKNKISSEQMKEQLKNENHLDAHPLLRVLYCVKGYYEF